MSGLPTSGHWLRPGRFLAASDDAAAPVVLLGAPMDATTSFRPGTRFGPARIREVSDGLEEYSPALDRELAEVPFFDAGDVDIPFGAPEPALSIIEAAVAEIVGAGRFPFVMGGEHLLTLAPLRAVAAAYPDLVVLQIDAHADLRDDYLGQRLSHATVMRRAAELLGPENVYQLGIRSGTKEEYDFGRRFTRFFPLGAGDTLRAAAEAAVAAIGQRPVYITLDIDVLDPAFAPGTGTPEPGGVHPGDLFQTLQRLQELSVVAMDLVEICPPQDVSDITAMMGAKIVRESILSFGGNFARRIWSGRG